MAETNCPICNTVLIVKEVTPCMECGANEFERDHYQDHEYAEYEVYFQQKLIFYDFCKIDFSSYDATFFGFHPTKTLGISDWAYIRSVQDKELRNDKYCPNCQYRLSFLKFIYKCRQENSK